MKRRNEDLFDKLTNLIPGYSGFKDKDSRRTADQALRRYLATRIDRLKRTVDDVVAARTNAGKLDGLAELDRLKQRLGTCADTIRHAPYGESGLRDDWVIDAATLDRVHEHDMALDARVDEVETAIGQLARDDDEGGDALAEARSAVDQLRADIEARERILSEVN